MFAQFFSLVLVNTYTWMGGQGYCTFDFALHEYDSEYEKVELVLRPLYDPENTATGATTLEDASLTLDSIGGSNANDDQSATVDSDCNVTGFDVVKATALENGDKVDLLAAGKVEIETYKALELKVQGK